jgi:hypothetical protein
LNGGAIGNRSLLLDAQSQLEKLLRDERQMSVAYVPKEKFRAGV